MTIKHDVSLKLFNTWRIGGQIKNVFWPTSFDELCQKLPKMPKPWLWLGRGSNVLCPEGLIDGTLIIPFPGLQSFQLLDQHRVYASCGIPSPWLAKTLAKHGLSGLECLIGIPGTVGGALAMNAGSNGQTIAPCVQTVWFLDWNCVIHQLPVSAFSFEYRQVTAPFPGWFLAVELQLVPSSPAEIQQQLTELIKKRRETQPINQPSCGSVFKNPPHYSAAMLIDQLNLKGLCCGGAQISSKHANFIINNGTATAHDILQLTSTIQQAVMKRYHVQLEPEFRLLCPDQSFNDFKY